MAEVAEDASSGSDSKDATVKKSLCSKNLNGAAG